MMQYIQTRIETLETLQNLEEAFPSSIPFGRQRSKAFPYLFEFRPWHERRLPKLCRQRCVAPTRPLTITSGTETLYTPTEQKEVPHAVPINSQLRFFFPV